MRLVNTLGPEHPFHLHGQFFEILSGGSVPGPRIRSGPRLRPRGPRETREA